MSRPKSGPEHAAPARYLVIIDAAGEMLARLFDAERRHLTDFDASSEEVAVMTSGLVPAVGADVWQWGHALEGHSAQELREARIYTLDI